MVIDSLVLDEPFGTESMPIAELDDEGRRIGVVGGVNLDDQNRSYSLHEQRLKSAEHIVLVALDVHLDELQPISMP